MSTITHIKDVAVGNEQVILALDRQAPVVIWNGETFTHLWFLLAKLPSLSHMKYVEAFAEISNFFWKGLTFRRIDSISDFQKQYNAQVESEKKHPLDVYPYRLTDFKIFDVSVMHELRIDKETLIHFVYHTGNGLPYRVVCPFPYPMAPTQIHYQILPLL
jgi:hypothetical protein